MLLGTTLAFCTHLNPSPQKYRERQKDAKFNGLIYIAANLLLKGTSGKFPFNEFYPFHASVLSLPVGHFIRSIVLIRKGLSLPMFTTPFWQME